MRASLIAILTWVFLFVGVAVGFLTELNMSSIVLQVLGWTLFILGSYIHYLSHKAHPKAHKGINEINYIAQRGIYSWVRHPGYLGLTLMFFGVAIAFGSVPALIIAAILTAYHYQLAYEEERLMLEKFGDAYRRYMNEVPDRFLPIRKLLRKLRSS